MPSVDGAQSFLGDTEFDAFFGQHTDVFRSAGVLGQIGVACLADERIAGRDKFTEALHKLPTDQSARETRAITSRRSVAGVVVFRTSGGGPAGAAAAGATGRGGAPSPTAVSFM